MKRNDLVKKLYCDTLLELCEEKPLSKVTATDIITRAQTARQTFYNHFRDINDLISYLPINFVDTASNSVYDMEAVRAAYTYAVEHKRFFSQLPTHSGQNNFRESFIEWMDRIFRDAFIPKNLDAEEQLYRAIAIVQYVYGVVDSFLEWCHCGLDWPVETLVQVQYDALPAFIVEAIDTESSMEPLES